MRLLLIAMMALSCQPVTKPVEVKTITVHDTVYVHDTVSVNQNGDYNTMNVDFAETVNIGN